MRRRCIWAAQARLVRKKRQTADSPVSSRTIRKQANPFYTEIDNFLLGRERKEFEAAADSGEEKKRPNNIRSLVLRRPQRLLNGDKAGAS